MAGPTCRASLGCRTSLACTPVFHDPKIAVPVIPVGPVGPVVDTLGIPVAPVGFGFGKPRKNNSTFTFHSQQCFLVFHCFIARLSDFRRKIDSNLSIFAVLLSIYALFLVIWR